MVNNNNKAFLLAKYAIMFATIFVAMMIDKAITLIPHVSMAVCVLLVTLSFCFLENKWSTAVLSGLFFGLSSLIKEFILPNPAGLVGALPQYYWPFITIIPRVLMGVIAFGVYKLMYIITPSIANQKKRQIVCITVATFFGLITNTVGFFSALEICRIIAHRPTDGVFVLIYSALLTNIVFEYPISLASVAFIVLGVRRGLKLGIDGNNWKLALNDEVNVSAVEAGYVENITETDNITKDEDAEQ